MLRSNRLIKLSHAQARRCTSVPPPPPNPEPTATKSTSTILKTVILGAAGLAIGWIGSELYTQQTKASESKDSATKVVQELAEVQGVITDRVYFDIQFGQSPDLERVVIGLYGEECPKTAKNFLSICEGFQKSPSKKLTYEKCKFHRVIPGFMLQSGDITSGDGSGGDSIYGNRFPDESFKYRHTGVGVVSMANRGPHTNSSQFFLCVAKTPWLDGRHVVFGQVLHGLPTLYKIESYGSKSGTVSEDIRIAKCGVLPKLEETLAYNIDKNEELDETGRAINRIMK